MKNLFKIFVAVAALFAYSCVTDATDDLAVNLGGGHSEITLSLEESRTHLGEKVDGVYPLYWSEGDLIAINGVASKALTAEQAGSAATSFVFDQTLTYPYNIVYPSPTTKISVDLGDVRAEATQRVVFLAEQPYTVGSFAKGAAPMYAYSTSAEETSVQMQHLAGALRFAVKGNGEVVTGVTVKALGGKIAGDFNVDCTDGTLTASDDATDTVTVTFAEPLTLGAEAAYIYVAVPAGSHGVLETTIATAEHDKMVVSFDSDAKPVNEGVVREFKEFTYKATTAADEEILIVTKEDLISFAANAANTKSAKLAGVIDMTGEAWTPVQGFAGTFDGDKEGGYYIKGLTAPLFGTVSGEIKNLKLTDVNIVVTENHHYGEKPVVYSGAIAYHIANGSLTGCYTSGKVEVNNTVFNVANDAIVGTYYDVCLGGMVGLIEGTVVSNCENHIDLTLTSCWNNENATGFSVKAGAMIGMAAVASQISSCVNYGSVSYEATHAAGKAAHIGALLGGTSADGSLTVLKDCTNHGDFNVSATATRLNTFYMGGVAGYLNAGVEELKNLTNLGCAELLGLGNSKEYRVGGIAGAINSPADNLVNGSKDDASKGCIVINGSADSKNGNCYIAGMAYACGGDLSNSKNYAKLTINGHNANIYLGGIAASNSSSSFINCENHGMLHYEPKDSGATYIGGILAQAYVGETSTNDKAFSITNCKNTANIVYKVASDTALAGLRAIGGIYGYGNLKNKLIDVTIDGCESTGIMTVVDYALKDLELAFGAIHAYTQYGKNVTIKNTKSTSKMYVGYDVNLTTGVATPIEGHVFAGKMKVAGVHAMHTRATIGENIDFAGEINIHGKFTKNDQIQIGGYGGYGTGLWTLTNCKFSGKIHLTDKTVFETSASKFVVVSGFLGYPANDTATNTYVFNNCTLTDTASITSGAQCTNGDLYIGGFLAYTAKAAAWEFNGCSNNATLTTTAATSTSEDIIVGGAIGWKGGSGVVTLKGCSNTANINIEAKSSKTLYVGGVVAGTNVSKLVNDSAYPNCYNSGNITIGNKSGDAIVVSGNTAIGGYIGYWSSTKGIQQNIFNSGEVSVSNVKSNTFYVGGVCGWVNTNKANIASGVVLTNVGNVTVSGIDVKAASTFVGGVIGSTTTAVTGAKCYCNVSAPGITNTGMIIGDPRGETPMVTNAHLGGNIALEMGENSELELVPILLPVDDSNYFNYIYGGETAWTGTDYDGCKYLPVAPTL